MRIALVGTRGVPARYGGFETAVQEIGRRLVQDGHEVVVYCRRGPDQRPPRRFLGMELVYVPAVRHKAMETLSHTALAVLDLARQRLTGRGPDAVVLFNAANSPLLPLLRLLRIPVATHVDGLEWQRAKWSGLGKKYYRMAESLAVRWSDMLIADARGIEQYYREEFGAASEFIAYGAPALTGIGSDRLADLGLAEGQYHLLVARFEPENHVRMAVAGYVASGARLPLVVVGSAPYGAAYTARIQTAAAASDRVRLVGPIWDQDLLDQLYANCRSYVHGHSVGGTNPSLLRAMGAGACCLAYDVIFNREVLGDAGRYFRGQRSLARLLDDAEADGSGTAQRGRAAAERARRYDWNGVADAYAKLLHTLHTDGPNRNRPSGRRTGQWADHAPVAAPEPSSSASSLGAGLTSSTGLGGVPDGAPGVGCNGVNGSSVSTVSAVDQSAQTQTPVTTTR